MRSDTGTSQQENHRLTRISTSFILVSSRSCLPRLLQKEENSLNARIVLTKDHNFQQLVATLLAKILFSPCLLLHLVKPSSLLLQVSTITVDTRNPSTMRLLLYRA
jgi:hypothetical protein